MYGLGARVTTELCREWQARGKIRELVIVRRLSSQQLP